ncbi:MAG TPA: DMT family transporter [Candidatus Limnocylindria bacterium]|nr:DMT family transporter [Candidatus Limnocylindria bacterium]
MSRRGWILFAAMAGIWGVPYLLIKVTVAELTPATLVLLRTTVAGAILVPLAIARREIRPLVPRWSWVLAYTFVEVAAPWIILSDAERRLSSSLAGLLISSVPLVGSVLVWIIGGDDRPDLRRIIGLIVGFAGVALVVGLDVATDDLVAVGEVGLVVIGYAIGPMIISRRLQGAPPVGVVAASLAVTALVYAPIGIAQLPSAMPSAQVLLSVVFLGVVCTAVAVPLFFALVGEVGPIRATIITYFNPAVALVLGVLLLNEPFTIGIALGFALIAGGSLVATRRPWGMAERAGVLPQGSS